MATAEGIMAKMRAYEFKVLTTLGFSPNDPVVLREVSREDEYVSFKWYGPNDPKRIPSGSVFQGAEYQDGVTYRIPRYNIDQDVWDAVMAARDEWEANFPRRHP